LVLLCDAGKPVAKRVFQHQTRRELELLRTLLQELHERPDQLAPVYVVRNAKVAVDVVDLLITVMKGMVGLRDEVTAANPSIS
jgi:hypothetical protein